MNKSGLKILSISFVLIFILSTSPAAAEDFYPGDVINLGGSSPSNYVYLFVVGSNLPSNGANPEDLQSAVVTDDSGSFVRATVNSGRWNYKWDTSTASGTPDPGVYRVYAASEPVGLHDLSSADYSVTVVNIVRPYVTAEAEGGMITAKTGVAAESVAEDTDDGLSESGTDSVTPTATEVSVAQVTESQVTQSVSESGPSEKSGISVFIPLFSAGILFVALFSIRKRE